MIDLPVSDAGDALVQPTRSRLFALLAELKRPAPTVELAERVKLHPNGVRLHLERLEAAGLVERIRVRRGPGRPRDSWTIAADARPGGEPPHAYHDLGTWLARAIRSPSTSLASIEDTGRQIGRELAPGRAEDELDASGPSLLAALTALGFQPRITREQGDRTTFCLSNCPYRDAVRENQPAICALHEGITRGLLDVLEPRARLASFVPHGPDDAACLVEVRLSA